MDSVQGHFLFSAAVHLTNADQSYFKRGKKRGVLLTPEVEIARPGDCRTAHDCHLVFLNIVTEYALGISWEDARSLSVSPGWSISSLNTRIFCLSTAGSQASKVVPGAQYSLKKIIQIMPQI